jgi:hypothetical protein
MQIENTTGAIGADRGQARHLLQSGFLKKIKFEGE